MNELHCLVYVSCATRELSQLELENILALSRVRNRAVGITAALLYCGGNFMQLLEGPRDAVLDTYRRIHRNQQHGQVVELLSEPVAAREFSDWSMAFSHATQPEFSRLRNAPWSAQEGSLGRELLSDFWRNNR